MCMGCGHELSVTRVLTQLVLVLGLHFSTPTISIFHVLSAWTPCLRMFDTFVMANCQLLFLALLTVIFTFCHQDASTDNKSEETGGQEGEKESTTEAMDDLDFNFSAKKKKKKKKVCELITAFSGVYMYVVVQFYPWFNFYFLLFYIHYHIFT